MMRLRREFSPGTKRAARERAAGICECARVPQLMAILRNRPCGRPLGPGNTFYEHIVPAELGGDGSLDNCACLVRTCWRLKTDLFDLPVIADAARQEDRHSGIGGPGRGRHPMRGGRQSPESRGMDGRVRQRLTLTQKLRLAGITGPQPQPVTELYKC